MCYHVNCLVQGEVSEKTKVLKLHLWKDVDWEWIKDMEIRLTVIFSYCSSLKSSGWTISETLNISLNIIGVQKWVWYKTE